MINQRLITARTVAVRGEPGEICVIRWYTGGMDYVAVKIEKHQTVGKAEAQPGVTVGSTVDFPGGGRDSLRDCLGAVARTKITLAARETLAIVWKKVAGFDCNWRLQVEQMARLKQQTITIKAQRKTLKLPSESSRGTCGVRLS